LAGDGGPLIVRKYRIALWSAVNLIERFARNLCSGFLDQLGPREPIAKSQGSMLDIDQHDDGQQTRNVERIEIASPWSLCRPPLGRPIGKQHS
jgi:hypothetical protein